MAGARRHTIVCLSSQRWDDGMWTNKHHIMSRLAREHEVYYVSHGTRAAPAMLFDRTIDGAALTRLMRPRVTRHDELKVLDFWAPPAARLFPHGSRGRAFLEFDLRVKLLARFFDAARIERPILWVYHPGYGDVVAGLPHELLVYDCVDEYTAFPEFVGHEDWIAERERALCARADVVFCTAPSLYESKRGLNPHTHLVHNVGDAKHFKRALDADLAVPADIAELPHPIVGFVGAVSDYK